MTSGTDEVAMLLHQGGIGVLAVYGLQLLKNSNWFPWISRNTGAINRWVGIAIAVATSVGIKIVVQGSAGAGWHLGADIPQLSVLIGSISDTIVHAAVQFSGQQVLYHTAVKETIGGIQVKKPVEPAEPGE